MNRNTMRAWLSRRTDGSWTDTQYDDFLSQACLTVAQLVVSIDPDFFMRIRKQSLEAGIPYYPRPVDARHIDSVFILDSSTGGYKPIEKRTRAFIRQRYQANGVSSGSDVVWARFGRYIQIDPAPTTSVADGLRIVEAYHPTLPETTSEPPHPLDLHQAIVNRAHRLLLPETADYLTLADSLDKEYQQMTQLWRDGYFETAEPQVLDVEDPGYFAEG